MTIQTIAELLDLTGKGAIVTGGAVGIGQGIAFRLAEAGASVMITDIDLEGAGRTVEQVKARGGKAQAIRADAGSTTDATKVAQATVDAFGRLDILVNSAGIYPPSPALQMSEELWDKVLNTDLKGMFFYSQAAAKQMIKAGHGGKIINLSSIDALRPEIMFAHYDAAKGGVVMLTKALALELAPHNILVNTVAPGGITTPGREAAAAAIGDVLQANPEAIVPEQPGIPLDRLGTPDDIAKVVLFLASAAADYMTGSLVLVDGGCLLS